MFNAFDISIIHYLALHNFREMSNILDKIQQNLRTLLRFWRRLGPRCAKFSGYPFIAHKDGLRPQKSFRQVLVT